MGSPKNRRASRRQGERSFGRSPAYADLRPVQFSRAVDADARLFALKAPKSCEQPRHVDTGGWATIGDETLTGAAPACATILTAEA